MVSEKECSVAGGKIVRGVCVLESYVDFLGNLEGLEHDLKNLPVVSLMEAQYLPLMLSRPICMAKEIAKWGSKADLEWLVDNQHIIEEIGLLQKDMKNLKEDLKLARLRREEVSVSPR